MKFKITRKYKLTFTKVEQRPSIISTPVTIADTCVYNTLTDILSSYSYTEIVDVDMTDVIKVIAFKCMPEDKKDITNQIMKKLDGYIENFKI